MPATLILNYAPAPTVTRSWRRYLLLVLSLPAVLIPILNFTFGISPLRALVTPPFDFDSSGIWLLGSGFFLAWLIVIWQALALLTTPHRYFRRAFAIIAILFLCVPATISVLGIDELLGNSMEFPATLIFGGNFLIVTSAILLSWRLARRNRPNAAILSLLLGTFIGHTMFCLVAFAPSWSRMFVRSNDPGYPLTFIITVLWSIEFLTLHVIGWRPISPRPNRPDLL